MNRHSPSVLALLALAGGALLGAPARAQVPQHTFYSASDYGLLGTSVGAAFDVNADGINDVLLGEPGDNDVGDYSGSVYVHSGADWSLLLAWHGAAAMEQFGYAVAGLGDVNGDGHADIAASAPFSGTNSGEMGTVRCYSGKNGALLWTISSTTVGMHFGYAIANAGDVNLDGIADLVVGAPGYDGVLGMLPDAGRVVVLSGATGSTLLSFTGGIGDYLGSDVGGAGDVNGDGRADVILGAPGEDALGPQTGRVDVRSGNGGALIFSRFGPHSYSFFGTDVDGAGDVDGDGFADVIVGAIGEGSFAGAAHVYRGPNGAASWTFLGDEIEDRFGQAVAAAGDVDKDGHADLLVGTFPQGSEKPPYARVLSGATGLPLYFTVTGPAYSGFGSAIAALGDVSGDGWADVIVGAPFNYDGFHFGMAIVYSPLWVQQDVGHGGPGLAKLSMWGTPLVAGGKADLVLMGAAPNRPALLAASLFAAQLPFKGGVLVPNLSAGLGIVMATDVNGVIALYNIPGGLGLFDAYLQVIVQDPAQPKGFALSNAVLAHFQN